ncbi:tail protein (tape measure) [Enterobacter hormaechei]|uniref:phage tail tape measure protein n=1 Tax=Enterobacter hormaechei TaxID=158836 RepID=UPI00254F5F82|nr:tail protein (tape measure) [Enterobacter hormaechei]MEC5518022.1 tail protein (tape measure) [Enterobacter hormaechei]
MAGEKNAGSIVYEISADVEPLLQGGKQAIDALDKLDAAAQQSGKGMDNLDQSTSQTGSAFTELAGYANSMDNQLRKLNTNVSGIARAMEEARSGTGGASSEFSRAESIIEALGNQLAVLDEAQENGARSAAVLAAQLRAGSKATDEEKQKIGELTGRLFDMKTASDTGAKGHGNWKSTMQQAGYQVQDFIVQVQGGQSALVAFSQQGSQLAGAFGPGGAVIGAVLALSTVVAGALITSLNSGKNAMDALKSAAETMDKVITISQNGVAALSDKYAALAQTNIAVATLMKKQAELELQAALSNVSKEVQKASSDFISFGDSLMSSLGGGYASVKLFNDYLSTLNITTNDFSEAWKQAAASGQAGQSTMNSMVATVAALSTKFDISDQKAFEFAKQLSDIAKTPTDEKLRALVVTLQDVGNGQSSGAAKAREYAKSLLTIMETSTDATSRLKALKEMTDSLTSSQDKALKIAQQELFIARQTGEAQMKAKAWRDAETQGLKEGTEAFRKYYNVKLATYKQDEANANSKKGASSAASEAKKLANQQETVAQKLENLRQQSELAAGSTQQLSREQAILTAQQSLGAAATQKDLELAGQYAAAKWDTANALKAQAAAEKLLPEARENASYKQDVQDLNTALAAKKISQEQFNQTSERLEATHQANLAKIRAQQAVTPQQEAVAQVDPVQQLANQHAQQLALIQQFEQQGLLAHQNALALKNAADTQYEQQRTAAQWELLSQQSLGYSMLTSAVDAFSGNASNALTGLITGTMSAQDAMRSLGNTMLNSVVNALVQVGVEALKNFIIGQTLGAAATAAGASQAAILATAWAPAAAMASLASFGANSVPAMTGIASTVGLAQGLALTGMRYNGGPVNAGGLYQVGERGKPEIYQASTGKQYMIPGDNGRVISNKDMQSGSGVIINNIVQNYTSATVDSQGTVNSDGSITLTTIIADLNNGGPISQGITSNFNVKRTPNGQG